jgi:ribonuclease P protein component
LKRRDLIRPLFDRNRDDVGSVARGCVRIVYRLVERVPEDVPVQIGFSPGRIATAVERNRVKRIMREVYRIHQGVLVDLFVHSDRTLTAMALFRGRAEVAGSCIPDDLPAALRDTARRLESATSREGSNLS